MTLPRWFHWRYVIFQNSRFLDKLLLPILTLPILRSNLTTWLLPRRLTRMSGFRLRLVDHESLTIACTNFEPFMQYWFKPQMGNVVLDIGANFGIYTLKSSLAVGPTGKVLAVEAHPLTFRVLSENIRLNASANAESVHCAVWKAEQWLTLFLANSSAQHSLKLFSGSRAIRVRARTLDSIVEERKIGHVDWIKIDVEGAELEVLQGAQKMLSRDRPKIILEVRPNQQKAVKLFASSNNYGIIEILSERDWAYWFLPRLATIGEHTLRKT
jgi:FkbM family methyltransferase